MLIYITTLYCLNSSDTHVVHHLFSTMPHYHAQEATEAVKEFLGKYYLYDSTPFMVALYRNYKLCKFVEDDGMYFTRSHYLNDLAMVADMLCFFRRHCLF